MCHQAKRFLSACRMPDFDVLGQKAFFRTSENVFSLIFVILSQNCVVISFFSRSRSNAWYASSPFCGRHKGPLLYVEEATCQTMTACYYTTIRHLVDELFMIKTAIFAIYSVAQNLTFLKVYCSVHDETQEGRIESEILDGVFSFERYMEHVNCKLVSTD